MSKKKAQQFMGNKPTEGAPPVDDQLPPDLPPESDLPPFEDDSVGDLPPEGSPPDEQPGEPTPITYPALVNIVREFNRTQASPQNPAIDLDKLPGVGETIQVGDVTYLVWVDGEKAAADVKPDEVVEAPAQVEVEPEPIHVANMALSAAQEATRTARAWVDETERVFDGLLKAATSEQLNPTKHSRDYIQASFNTAKDAFWSRARVRNTLTEAWAEQEKAEIALLKLEQETLIAARTEHEFHYPES